MKLKFREDTLPTYTFKDLEYGMKLLELKVSSLKEQMYAFIRESEHHSISKMQLKVMFLYDIDKLELKIALVEDEITNRVLTGNDDGMFEETVLGG